MAEFTLRKLEQGDTRIKSVPVAVTPEGFWCCPSPAAIQKTLKNQNLQNKPRATASPPHSSKASSLVRTTHPPVDKRLISTSLRSRLIADDHRCLLNSSIANPVSSKHNAEVQQRNISVGFGQLETSDLKVVLRGKGGSSASVRMSVHCDVLAENSSFFADELRKQSPALPLLVEIADCEDVESYVETVGLMYSKDLKQRIMKQSVARVVRILKVAETLGFHACIKTCLDFLESAPWIGEEEEMVVSSIQHLQDENHDVMPILSRVASDLSTRLNPSAALSQIVELVLESNDDRARREVKPLVLKLLKENNLITHCSADISVQSLYASCGRCLESLLNLFKQAREKSMERQIALEADNLLWLVEILIDRHEADEFASTWASQSELAQLHSSVPSMWRHGVSRVSSRIFVGIGTGEMVASMETRRSLLLVWLQPLIDDYRWLQRGSRSFDGTVVEEGIGRTILTLPLEEQQSILVSWLGRFLKAGDDCPNLQRAFEVWWRRTFIRPYVEHHAIAGASFDHPLDTSPN